MMRARNRCGRFCQRVPDRAGDAPISLRASGAPGPCASIVSAINLIIGKLRNFTEIGCEFVRRHKKPRKAKIWRLQYACKPLTLGFTRLHRKNVGRPDFDDFASVRFMACSSAGYRRLLKSGDCPSRAHGCRSHFLRFVRALRRSASRAGQGCFRASHAPDTDAAGTRSRVVPAFVPIGSSIIACPFDQRRGMAAAGRCA